MVAGVCDLWQQSVSDIDRPYILPIWDHTCIAPYDPVRYLAALNAAIMSSWCTGLHVRLAPPRDSMRGIRELLIHDLSRFTEIAALHRIFP